MEWRMTKVVGGKIPEKEHRKLKIEDRVEFMLDRMIFAKPIWDREKDVVGAAKFTPSQMGPMWISLLDDAERLSFFHPDDVNSWDLVWPMRFGFSSFRRGDDEWGDHVHCNWFETVDPKALRGKFRNFGRRNVAWMTGYITSDMKFHTSHMVGSWFSGKWGTAQRLRYDGAFMDAVRDAGMAPRERLVTFGEDDIGSRIAIGQTMALTYRYEWGAQFSIGRSARVIIPTTPGGVLELFNDRDKPEDRDRRAALRHWVRQHLRRKRRGDFSKVRAHLRGSTKFSWRGFDVEIVPSAYDEERSAA